MNQTQQAKERKLSRVRRFRETFRLWDHDTVLDTLYVTTTSVEALKKEMGSMSHTHMITGSLSQSTSCGLCAMDTGQEI